MGCFLGCFGHRRKNRRRQRRRESFQPPRLLNRISDGSLKDNLSALKEVPKVAEELAKDDHLIYKAHSVVEAPKVSICDKVDEEKQSPSPTRKRVTFDSNVKTYEHIAVEESVEIFEEKKPEETTLGSTLLAPCSSEGSNITSISSGSSSYPSNHRYQNCRESDDEEEEGITDCGESNLEDSDDDGLLQDDYYDDDNYDWDKEVYTEEIADNVLDIEERTRESKASARDRSEYVNAVLNPIENLTQWKALKSKGRTTTQTPTHKENTNLISNQEHKPDASFSLEEPKSRDETKKQRRTQEVAVDASLSTWLTTSQTTTSGCSSDMSETATSAKHRNKSRTHDERPVLCALTAEEIKQYSATNSPRKSPSRSPESPIIGTVGGYWNNQTIANRKYREV